MPNIHNTRTGWTGSCTQEMYDYLIQKEEFEDVPDDYVPAGEEDVMVASNPVSYTYASNGRWTIYVGDEAADKGRGKDDLAAALDERGETLETATEREG